MDEVTQEQVWKALEGLTDSEAHWLIGYLSGSATQELWKAFQAMKALKRET